MLKDFINFIISLFGSASKEAEPRQDASGYPIKEEPKELAIEATRKKYLDASKKLYPKAVRFVEDPTGTNEKINPKYVILHHTVSRDLEGTVKLFVDKNVSVHFVVGKDGKVIQMQDCDRKCWHAGESSWKGLTGLNSYSIGIEVVNMGPLKKLKDGTFIDYYNKKFQGPVHVRKGLGYEYWDAITPQAEEAVIDLCCYLHDVLNIPAENFLGHYEIAPKRKNDPFGMFTHGDMTAFRRFLKTIF